MRYDSFSYALIVALVVLIGATLRQPEAATTTPSVNPQLTGLAANTAVDLGAYACKERMPQIAERCESITDFSRFNYDPIGHRILMFGGGHAATGRTDIDVLDLTTLRWSSLYPSMSCEDVAAGDLDPRGFHTKTGHPVARHTYDMTVVTATPDAGQLLLLSTEGFPGTCHKYKSKIAAVAAFPLMASSTSSTWTYSKRFKAPWHYHSAAEFDPISGMVIIVGARRGSGEGGMWVFDPVAARVVTFVDEVAYGGHDNNLLFFPPDNNMYLMQRGEPSRVWQVALNRDNWSATRSQSVQIEGAVSHAGATGWAYDQANRIFGGAVVDGAFHTFDPVNRAWSRHEINIQSSEGANIGSSIAHHLDYDPVNNVYYFIANGNKGKRTWAYRFKTN